jgi:hypothetical protein
LTVLWVPPFFLFPTEEITTIRIPPALSIKPNRKRNKVSIYFLVGKIEKYQRSASGGVTRAAVGKKVRHDDLHRYPPIVFCFSSFSCDSFFPDFSSRRCQMCAHASSSSSGVVIFDPEKGFVDVSRAA